MKDLIKSVLRDERGASIVEPLLYAALIATAVFVAVTVVGGNVRGGATNLGSSVQSRLTPTWS